MRERFLALDGLRGLAALVVLVLHLGMPSWLSRYPYLAVDFFFVLSGFVIAHAYEERLRAPGSLWGFLRERVIRLHPMLALSMVPGAVMMALGASRRDPYPLLTVLAAPIPFPALWKAELPRLPFPLNLPSWSLFWELVTNIVFALIAPWLSTRVLASIVAVTCAALGAATLLELNLGGDRALAGLRAIGLFPLGVLLLRVHRSGRVPLERFGAWAAPLFLAALVIPWWSAGAHDFVARFVLLPAVVLLGASRQARFPRACTFLGGISYPLYILQLPLLVVIEMATGLEPGLVPGVFCIAIVWAVWRFCDVPVRAWLTRRFVRRPEKA